jgi:hypothetical protein
MSLAHEDGSACRDAITYMLAGAMFSLLRWWLDSGKSASPAQMDEVFHQMVWGVVRKIQ